MDGMMCKAGKTKVVEVPYSRRWFLTGVILLMFCLCLFCSDAGAVYRITNIDYSEVSGLYSSGSGTWDGSDFGDTSYPGWVIGIANDDWGFGIWADGGDLTITGDLASGSTIGGVAWTHDAYGLYSSFGDSIHTGALNGTIYAIAGTNGAYGLYDYYGDINTGNIGGTITATAGENSAYGMFSFYGSINTGEISGVITTIAEGSYSAGLYSVVGDVNTGDITGTIDVTAGSSWAIGLGSEANSVITGDIDGTIIVRAEDGYAYGLYSGSGLSIHTGDINGTISADVNNGNYAYALYSDSNMTVGNIGSDAEIIATANNGRIAGGLRSNGSIDVCDIDGTITASANRHVYGLRTDDGDITTGAINGEITTTAEYEMAFGLYSNGGSITTGDINGTITTDVNSGMSAYGLRSVDGSITTGDIGGTITVTADEHAYGLRSEGGDITTGAITGDINTTVEHQRAFGLFADGGSITINGDVNGTITATAADKAWALRSDEGAITITGDINGKIVAIASNGSDAYGLYSNSATSIHTGDINGEITAFAEVDNAYGLYSAGGYICSINTGDIYGTITADANTGSYAYGMYTDSDINVGDIGSSAHISASAGDGVAYGMFSGGSITTGSINGEISASTGQQEAYAMWSYGDITVNGDIGSSAYIWAYTGGDTAYALFSDDSIYINGDIDGDIYAGANNNAFGLYSIGLSTIETGDINGTIVAEANGSGAYALYSDSGIEVGDIERDALISATAGDGYAYGLYSAAGDSIHTGDINGTISAEVTDGSRAYALYSASDIYTGDIGSDANITATASGWHARGLYSNNGDIDTNDIDGKITATAGENYAYALHSNNGDITTDDIGSTAVITATATRSRAYGLFSEDGDITTGAINGTINATAGDKYAYGLYCSYDDFGSLITGDITGDINATANYQACGLFSEGVLLTTGDISGTITATSATETAYGLRSWGDINTGDISGAVTATAGERKAAGFFSEGALTTGAISGTITAYSDADYVFGILSYDSMDILIDGGEVNAIADGGPHAAAIQSGRVGAAAIGLVTQNADDTVEIVAGSTIVGDIDLAQNGSDDDLLTLSGNVSDSTIFDDDINNVETIDITGGTWYVNGTISNSTNGITMYDGYLGGIGTLCSLHVIDGMFAPGESIDTIYIDGNWTQDSDGIYEVEIDNAENADLTILTGWVDLDGTIIGSAPTVSGQRIDHSFSALVIDANTGLYNAFDTVTGTTLFPIYSVTYDAGNYDVYLDVEFDYAYYADTDNQHSVGDAFNHIVEEGLDTGDMNDVLWAIEHLPDGDAVNDAYNKMMPQDALGLPDITRKLMNSHNDSVMDRMDSLRRSSQYAMLPSDRYLLASADNSVALPSQTDEWMPFVKGLGAWGDRDEDSDVAGYNYSFYGIVAGMDKYVSENTLFGFGFGGSMANVDYTWSGTNADIDSFICSAHGSYFKDDWHLDWNVAYAHSWYDSQRRISFDAISREAKSDHQGNAYSAAVEFGKDLGDSSMILEPIAGLGYTVVQQNSYKEKGADSLNLKVKADSSDGLYSKVGIRAAKEIDSEDSDVIMVPKLTAFWIHDFADRVELSSSFIDGGSFKTEGLDAVRDTIDVGAGLNLYFGDNKQLYFDYSWQSANNFNAHVLQTGVQWSF